MKTTTQKIVISALFAALVCVATMLIRIPSPLKGYINLGDVIVLLCGFVLPCGYGFAAAGIGSALADVFAGYITYAPATFVIKGIMALIVHFMCLVLLKNTKDFVAKLISALTAEIFMVLGYFVFEGFLYGFGPSIINIPANAVQGIAGVIFGIILVKVFKKQNLIFK